MRLDINLASQPYEDARQFWMRWGTAVGAVALLTLVLLTLDVTGWVNARRDRAAIDEKKAMIADRDQLRADAERILNLPQNRTTRDESQFLNELIERKAFSWTRVLENLEKVMPPRVHLIAISPELDEDNHLGLKMTVAGDSRDTGDGTGPPHGRFEPLRANPRHRGNPFTDQHRRQRTVRYGGDLHSRAAACCLRTGQDRCEIEDRSESEAGRTDYEAETE